MKPVIHYGLCRSDCAKCVEVCPVNVFTIINGVPRPTHPELCTACRLCERACSSGAIFLKD